MFQASWRSCAVANASCQFSFTSRPLNLCISLAGQLIPAIWCCQFHPNTVRLARWHNLLRSLAQVPRIGTSDTMHLSLLTQGHHIPNELMNNLLEARPPAAVHQEATPTVGMLRKPQRQRRCMMQAFERVRDSEGACIRSEICEISDIRHTASDSLFSILGNAFRFDGRTLANLQKLTWHFYRRNPPHRSRMSFRCAASRITSELPASGARQRAEHVNRSASLVLGIEELMSGTCWSHCEAQF